MNKTVASFFLLFCLSFYPLMAEIEKSLEVRAHAFFPSSDRFRGIYGDVSADYALEACVKFSDYCFETWLNCDWFFKHGHSIGFRDPTRVSVASCSFGIKFPYQLSERFSVYAGIGPSFSGIWIKNRSEQHHEHVSQFVVGGVVKTGVCCCFSRGFFLNLFADYLYEPTHFRTHADIGGFKTGIGIGKKF